MGAITPLILIDDNVAMEYLSTTIHDLINAVSTVEHEEDTVLNHTIDGIKHYCYAIIDIRNGSTLITVEDLYQELHLSHYRMTFGLFVSGHYSLETAQNMTQLFLQAFPELHTSEGDAVHDIMNPDHDWSQEISHYTVDNSSLGVSPLMVSLLKTVNFVETIQRKDDMTVLNTLFYADMIVNWWRNCKVSTYSGPEDDAIRDYDISMTTFIAGTLESGAANLDETITLLKHLVPMRYSQRLKRQGYHEDFLSPLCQQLDTIEQKRALVELLLYFQCSSSYPEVDSEALLSLLKDEGSLDMPASLMEWLVC